jgi:hypothetical protein
MVAVEEELIVVETEDIDADHGTRGVPFAAEASADEDGIAGAEGDPGRGLQLAGTRLRRPRSSAQSRLAPDLIIRQVPG